jgi:hypothetical protein
MEDEHLVHSIEMLDDLLSCKAVYNYERTSVRNKLIL